MTKLLATLRGGKLLSKNYFLYFILPKIYEISSGHLTPVEKVILQKTLLENFTDILLKLRSRIKSNCTMYKNATNI